MMKQQIQRSGSTMFNELRQKAKNDNGTETKQK